MKKQLGQAFLRGLSVVIPVAVTVYVIYWIGSIFDAVLVFALKAVGLVDGDKSVSLYGLGTLAALALVFLVGVFTRGWIGRAVNWVELLIQRIPVLGGLYGALKDMMGMFGGDPAKSFSKVVLVKVPGSDMTMLGLVTRQDFSEIPQVGDGEVAVYLPMSYQMGGFTFMVPRDQLTDLDMTAEAGMQFALTAAMSLRPSAEPTSPTSSMREGLGHQPASTAQEPPVADPDDPVRRVTVKDDDTGPAQ